MQLFTLRLTSFPSDWLLPCPVDLFICFQKKKTRYYSQFSKASHDWLLPCPVDLFICFQKKTTRYYSQFSKASHRSLLISYCFVLLTFFSVVNEYFPSGPLKPKHNFLRAKDSSKVAFRRVKNYVRLFRSGRRTSCTKIERKYA